MITVDIYCQSSRADGIGLFTMVHKVMQIQSCLIAATEMASADVLIAPAINVSGISAKNEQDRAIQAGYKAARDSLSNIRTAIERWTDYL